MAQKVTVEDVRDMLGGCIPVRDVEQILVQAYNFTQQAAQDLIAEATSTPLVNMWGRTLFAK